MDVKTTQKVNLPSMVPAKSNANDLADWKCT